MVLLVELVVAVLVRLQQDQVEHQLVVVELQCYQ